MGVDSGASALGRWAAAHQRWGVGDCALSEGLLQVGVGVGAMAGRCCRDVHVGGAMALSRRWRRRAGVEGGGI